MYVFFYAFTARTNNTNLIAITQIAPHPSLDCIREGFLNVFQKAYPNYQIDYQNAQGSQPLSIQIAQKFSYPRLFKYSFWIDNFFVTTFGIRTW